MFRLAGILFVVIVLVLILYRFLPRPALTYVLPTGFFQQIAETFEPTPSPTITPYPLPNLLPTTLIIPKLNISANIEHVGTTATGAMEVPSDAAQAGWYRGSAQPGLWGDAVISGHFDTPSGRPAIFYNLRKLAKGDEIRVLSQEGKENIFEVVSVESVPYTKLAKELVFYSNKGVNLNLITCDGIWNPKDKNYNRRLVVYSTLKI